MLDIIAILRSKIGRYTAEGINHSGDVFFGELVLAALPGNRGVSVRYTASGRSGEIYHEEATMIAPDPSEKVGLWTINTNAPSLMQHELRSTAAKPGATHSFRFGFGGDTAETTGFREEIAIHLWPEGDLNYDYAWGLPGGEFVERTSLRLKPVAPAKRHPSIVHWREILAADDSRYPGSDELLAYGAALGKHFGLKRLGIHHEVLPPGRRTSWPHAEKTEEEFVYVVKGYPTAWLDGETYPLIPGDAVGFPPGTGLSHTFINDSQDDVHLLVVGDTTRPDNKYFYPLHPKRNEEVKDGLWTDFPHRPLGPHGGEPRPRPSKT